MAITHSGNSKITVFVQLTFISRSTEFRMVLWMTGVY